MHSRRLTEELPKCIKKEMSPKSNLVGNPAEPLSNEYSPATAGAQGASLTAKQDNILVNRKYMMEILHNLLGKKLK